MGGRLVGGGADSVMQVYGLVATFIRITNSINFSSIQSSFFSFFMEKPAVLTVTRFRTSSNMFNTSVLFSKLFFIKKDPF